MTMTRTLMERPCNGLDKQEEKTKNKNGQPSVIILFHTLPQTHPNTRKTQHIFPSYGVLDARRCVCVSFHGGSIFGKLHASCACACACCGMRVCLCIRVFLRRFGSANIFLNGRFSSASFSLFRRAQLLREERDQGTGLEPALRTG